MCFVLTLGSYGCASGPRGVEVMDPVQAETPPPRVRGIVLMRAGVPRAEGKNAAERRHAFAESWRVVEEQRVALKDCYRRSLARSPQRVVRMNVKLSVTPWGSIDAVRSDGSPLGDELGDACLGDAFGRSQIADPVLYGEELAELPLVFYVHAGRSSSKARRAKGPVTNSERQRARDTAASYNEASARAGQNMPAPQMRRWY